MEGQSAKVVFLENLAPYGIIYSWGIYLHSVFITCINFNINFVVVVESWSGQGEVLQI